MPDDRSSPEILVERIRALEKQTRNWKLLSLLAFALVLASWARGLWAQGRQGQAAPAQAVEAQSFVLKDANGTVRGQLSLRENTPTLELYDASGRVMWSTAARVAPAR
jgi:hypothetical protein